MPEVPKELNSVQRKKIKKLLDSYADIFGRKDQPFLGTKWIKHEIHMEGPPIRQPFRRQNPMVWEQEQVQLQKMLRDNVIRPSCSPWASPVVMVKKRWYLKTLH